MSHEEANEHRANPFFRAGVNDSYSLNCQTCVVAYELRRRGYDVMAVPRDNYATGILANLVSLAWVDPTTGTYPVRQVNAKVSNGKQAVKWFEGAVKQGERYLLTVNLDGGGGHVVILTRNEDGVLMVYDPQSGDRFLGEKEILDSFMRLVEVKYSMQEGFSPAILRVDNAQVNVPFIRKIIRRRHDP